MTPDVEAMAQAAYRALLLGGFEHAAHCFAVAPMTAMRLPATVGGVEVVPREDVGNEQCWLMRRVDLESDDE